MNNKSHRKSAVTQGTRLQHYSFKLPKDVNTTRSIEHLLGGKAENNEKEEPEDSRAVLLGDYTESGLHFFVALEKDYVPEVDYEEESNGPGTSVKNLKK